MARKSVGSGAPASEWEVALSGFDDNGATGTVVFVSQNRPGIVLALTLVLDGTETVVGFEVRQQQPARSAEAAIGTRLLRSVLLGQLAHEAMQELRRRAHRAANPQFWRDDPAGEEQALLETLALQSVPLSHGRPGRRGYPLRHYAELAVQYEEWRLSGDRLATLAKQKHMSESALRAALGAARRKGLLTPAPPGRAGGSATEKARAILRAAAEKTST